MVMSVALGVGVKRKMDDQAHASLRCGAKTRRGTPCANWGMKNGRCRMHGGMSTGPKTPEGKERSRRANWKHGHYSRAAKEEHRRLRKLIQELSSSLRGISG